MNDWTVLVPQVVDIAKTWGGIALPPFVDLVNQKVANDKVRFIISVLASIALALALNLDKVSSGDWTDLLLRASFVFAQAQIVYKLYWDKSKIRKQMLDK